MGIKNITDILQGEDAATIEAIVNAMVKITANAIEIDDVSGAGNGILINLNQITFFNANGDEATINYLDSSDILEIGVGTLKAGGSEVFTRGNLSVDTQNISIADNGVATITPPKNGGVYIISCGGGGAYPQMHLSGMGWYDCGSTPGHSVISFGSSFASAGLDVNLIGTTGTDGNATISVQSDGTIKLENRGGSTYTFNITFL